MDKPDQDGNCDVFFINTKDVEGGILVDFETWCGDNPYMMTHDKYLIRVDIAEYL